MDVENLSSRKFDTLVAHLKEDCTKLSRHLHQIPLDEPQLLALESMGRGRSGVYPTCRKEINDRRQRSATA